MYSDTVSRDFRGTWACEVFPSQQLQSDTGGIMSNTEVFLSPPLLTLSHLEFSVEEFHKALLPFTFTPTLFVWSYVMESLLYYLAPCGEWKKKARTWLFEHKNNRTSWYHLLLGAANQTGFISHVEKPGFAHKSVTWILCFVWNTLFPVIRRQSERHRASVACVSQPPVFINTHEIWGFSALLSSTVVTRFHSNVPWQFHWKCPMVRDPRHWWIWFVCVLLFRIAAKQSVNAVGKWSDMLRVWAALLQVTVC